MPADPRFVAEWISREGPYLLHLCRSPELMEQILREGLLPHDVSGKGYYDGPNSPRPGHVYLCTPAAALTIWCQIGSGPMEDAPWVSIDIRQLDPAAFNPDEDCGFESFVCSEDEVVPLGHCSDPALCVRDEWTGDMEAMRSDPAAWAARPYISYGEWAEEEGFGDDPAQTEHAWRVIGSLAYRGSIPAQALAPVTVTREGEISPRSLAPAAA